MSLVGTDPSVVYGLSLEAIDNTATGNNPLYIGYAPIGTPLGSPSWAIKQLGYDGNGNVNRITWASVTEGIPSINLIWNNRASYIYS